MSSTTGPLYAVWTASDLTLKKVFSYLSSLCGTVRLFSWWHYTVLKEEEQLCQERTWNRCKWHGHLELILNNCRVKPPNFWQMRWGWWQVTFALKQSHRRTTSCHSVLVCYHVLLEGVLHFCSLPSLTWTIILSIVWNDAIVSSWNSCCTWVAIKINQMPDDCCIMQVWLSCYNDGKLIFSLVCSMLTQVQWEWSTSKYKVVLYTSSLVHFVGKYSTYPPLP